MHTPLAKQPKNSQANISIVFYPRVQYSSNNRKNKQKRKINI